MANSEYRGTATGSAGAKKKSAVKTKTVVTPGTKVSQATIDKIKAMGMTKALKSASGASAEMREGLKRLYGAKRVSAVSKPVATSADSARSGVKPTKPVTKSADAARSGASKMGANTVMAKPKVATTNIAQKDMYGNKIKSSVTISSPEKKTNSSKKPAYKIPTQKDMYGNKIK